MNYRNTRTIINESGLLNTNGTLGNSHFADTSYPSVSQTKGGYMKLNIELSDIQVKAINEFLLYDDIGIWIGETTKGDEVLHTEFYRALRKINNVNFPCPKDIGVSRLKRTIEDTMKKGQELDGTSVTSTNGADVAIEYGGRNYSISIKEEVK